MFFSGSTSSVSPSSATQWGLACATDRRSDRCASIWDSRPGSRRSRAPARTTSRVRARRAGPRFTSASGRRSDDRHDGFSRRNEDLEEHEDEKFNPRDLGLQTAEGAADPVREILSKLIDRELIVAEVDRYAPPEPTSEAIDRETGRIRMRFPTSEAFVAILERSGTDEKQLREIVRQDLRIRAYLDQRFASAQERRQALMDDWLSSLRRRGDVVDLYLSAR